MYRPMTMCSKLPIKSFSLKLDWSEMKLDQSTKQAVAS